MATFIRIKRRLCDEPLESIVVRPKRMRVEGGAAKCLPEDTGGGGGGGDVDEGASTSLPPPTVLERIGTVESKDAGVDSSMLKEYKKGWELRQSYKRLGGAEGGWREAGRRMAKERERESRDMLTNKHRGNITDADTHTEDDGEEDASSKKRKPTNPEEEDEGKKKKKEEEEEEAEAEEAVQFYDAKISIPQLKPEEDVITCNGEPMESEKFVYDIYYYPQGQDWSEFVFEHTKLMPEKEEKEEEEEEEDDENEEDNWRNDYPEEDDEEDEDGYGEEYDYFEKPTKRRDLLFDDDESYDEDDYEENDEDDCGFDEDGNLITISALGDRLKMAALNSGDDSD